MLVLDDLPAAAFLADAFLAVDFFADVFLAAVLDAVAFFAVEAEAPELAALPPDLEAAFFVVAFVDALAAVVGEEAITSLAVS